MEEGDQRPARIRVRCQNTGCERGQEAGVTVLNLTRDTSCYIIPARIVCRWCLHTVKIVNPTMRRLIEGAGDG